MNKFLKILIEVLATFVTILFIYSIIKIRLILVEVFIILRIIIIVVVVLLQQKDC